MKKHFALIDGLGKIIQTVQTKEDLEAPWILINQPSVTGTMVYNSETGLFEEPAE